MSSSFRLELRASVRLALALAVLHAAALGAAILSLKTWPLAFMASGIAISGIWSIVRTLNIGKGGILALAWDDGGTAMWCNSSGNWGPVDELRPGYVSPWLTIVWIRPSDGHHTVRGQWLVLGPDSASPEELRQLRVMLRAGLHKAVPKGVVKE